MQCLSAFPNYCSIFLEVVFSRASPHSRRPVLVSSPHWPKAYLVPAVLRTALFWGSGLGQVLGCAACVAVCTPALALFLGSSAVGVRLVLQRAPGFSQVCKLLYCCLCFRLGLHAFLCVIHSQVCWCATVYIGFKVFVWYGCQEESFLEFITRASWQGSPNSVLLARKWRLRQAMWFIAII